MVAVVAIFFVLRNRVMWFLSRPLEEPPAGGSEDMRTERCGEFGGELARPRDRTFFPGASPAPPPTAAVLRDAAPLRPMQATDSSSSRHSQHDGFMQRVARGRSCDGTR